MDFESWLSHIFLVIKIYKLLLFNLGEIESWIAFDNEKNTWKCLMCGKGTGLRKDNIKRHFKLQHMENPLVRCHVCHGVYKNETSLRQHMYTHMHSN